MTRDGGSRPAYVPGYGTGVALESKHPAFVTFLTARGYSYQIQKEKVQWPR